MKIWGLNGKDSLDIIGLDILETDGHDENDIKAKKISTIVDNESKDEILVYNILNGQYEDNKLMIFFEENNEMIPKKIKLVFYFLQLCKDNENNNKQ